MGILRDGDVVRFDSDHARLRVVLLTSDDPQHVYLRRLLAHRLDLVATVVEPGADQQRRLRQRRRYQDWFYRTYQRKRQQLTGRARYRREYFHALEAELPTPVSPVHQVSNINNDEVRALVADLRPDLTVVCGTGILGKRLITATPGTIFNLHGGWLPEYKGNHGIYFAYRAGDWDRIGATIHAVTPQLDCGPIVEKVTPDIFPHDNDEHLYTRSVHQGALRIIEIAARLQSGESLTLHEQEECGTTYRHRDRRPLPEFALWLRRLSGRHRVPLRTNTVRHIPGAQ